MADDTDEIPDGRAAAGTAVTDGSRRSDGPPPLSWPLVERRRSNRTPPGGIDRRAPRPAPTAIVPTLAAAPLWPFRLAALAGALFRAVPDIADGDWTLIGVTIGVVAYTIYAWLRPIPYRDDATGRLRVVVEQSFNIGAVALTGAWASPFVLYFVPTGMLAGLAAGGMFSVSVSAAGVAVVTAQHVADIGTKTGLQDGALWAGLLTLVAFTSGLAHRAALDAARQQQVALDRVSRLAEANSLLFALQRVAQTLPASLDYDDVLDSTVGRLRTMMRHDALAVYLVEPATRRVVPARTEGIQQPRAFPLDRLPNGLQNAIESPKTVRIDDLPLGGGVEPAARCGLYAALRARGALVGVLAVECRAPGCFGQQQAEVVHGLSEPFGIAIDNARMFLRIRTLAADEERSRIARDLHDHVGSSLALVGFEIDRALSVAADESEVKPVLRELRSQVSALVTEVRDTLYDLRTEVSDTRDLTATTTEFLQRVAQRSGIKTNCDIRLPERLPLIVEREVWQIVREAIVNAERHAQAVHLMVAARQTPAALVISVRDDGVGLDATSPRADSYGLVGMRERAHRIDADLSIRSLANGGTEVRLELSTEGAPSA